MSEVYATRRERLRERCTASGSATALVTRPANVRYLAGAAPHGSVLLLLGRGEDVLLCGGPPTGDAAEGRPDEAVDVRVLPRAAEIRPSPRRAWPRDRAPSPSPSRSTT